MNKILAIGCALAIIANPAVSFAAPLSAPQAPTAVSRLELVGAVTMTAVANGTHVYQQPDASSKVVSTLAAGANVTVLDKTSNGMWAHVEVGNVTGYVRVKTLK
jgi:uncharacterized protein YgiM (DUF1202 family)